MAHDISMSKEERKAQKLVMDKGMLLRGHGWWDSSYQSIWSKKDVAVALLKGEEVSLKCRYCNEPLDFDTSEHHIEVVNSRCENAYGVSNQYSVTIGIPSGRIVFANDLRQFFDESGERKIFDVNSLLGQRECTEYYASRGMAHGFVGSTNPGVFLIRNHLSIVQLNHDFGDPESENRFGKCLGRIFTGLWWYSLADHDLLLERGLEDAGIEYGVADVDPGEYVLTHYPLADGFETPPFAFAQMVLSE